MYLIATIVLLAAGTSNCLHQQEQSASKPDPGDLISHSLLFSRSILLQFIAVLLGLLGL